MEIKDIKVKDFSKETKQKMEDFIHKNGKFECKNGSVKAQIVGYLNNLKTVAG